MANNFSLIQNLSIKNEDSSIIAFGETLKKLAKEKNNVIAVDADVGSSTKTVMIRTVDKNRFVQSNIAEANMIGVSAGLANAGFNVFTSSFAIFMTGQPYNQIRQSIAYENLSQTVNVKLVGTHAGIATGPDGPTHHGTEDIGLMSMLPQKIVEIVKKKKNLTLEDNSYLKFITETNMKILCPADAVQTQAIIDWAGHNEGPMYIRLPRGKQPNIYEKYEYESNEPDVLYETKDAEVTLFVHGTLVFPALKLAKECNKSTPLHNFTPMNVVNVHTISPLNKSFIKKYANDTGAFVVAEDHVEIGGLLTNILHKAKLSQPRKHVFVPGFTESASKDELYKKYGLSEDAIFAAVRGALFKKYGLSKKVGFSKLIKLEKLLKKKHLDLSQNELTSLFKMFSSRTIQFDLPDPSPDESNEKIKKSFQMYVKLQDILAKDIGQELATKRESNTLIGRDGPPVLPEGIITTYLVPPCAVKLSGWGYFDIDDFPQKAKSVCQIVLEFIYDSAGKSKVKELEKKFVKILKDEFEKDGLSKYCIKRPGKKEKFVSF